MDELEFVVYQGNEFRRQFVGHGSMDLVARGIHTSAFTLDDDDEALADLGAPRARVAVRFRGEEHTRGPVKVREGVGPEGTVTCTVEDDIRQLWLWQGWPNPTAAIGSQAVEYGRYQGASESVTKQMLSQAVNRLEAGWTVAPSLGRGQLARVMTRFDPLGDKLAPLWERDNHLPVFSYSAGPRFDIREASDIPGTLTTESGVLDEYRYSRTAPTVTRVVIGGGGEGASRMFRRLVDSAAEAEWGFIAEGFVDAGNTTDANEMDDAGREALAAGAARTGLSATLVETDRFWFGHSDNPDALTYRLGDRARFLIGTTVDTIQPIAGVSVTSSPDEGVTVEPRIGEVELDVESRLAKQVAALARGLREQRRRR
jgi:hypothetical protein